MTDWQPIESAPRDGRDILLGRRGVRSFVGHAATAGPVLLWLDDHGLERDPTHWQPLPEPPGE